MNRSDPASAQLDRPGLAAYAVPAHACGQREHPDPWAERSPPLVLDRHRVLHSAAFRRLQYKTQVFLSTEGDHFRTRLTHTMEVAHVARCLCQRLRLTAELAEGIALAHDLGHAPFGHAGEAALDERMQGHGGFSHNGHSLRVVEYLEHPYPPFRGLNLTLQVREGLAKHAGRYDKPIDHPLADGKPASLEAQAATLADRLAYDGHDLEDALAAQLVHEDQLARLDLWREAAEPVRATFPDLPTPAVRRPILDRLVAILLHDAAEQAQQNPAPAPPGAPGEAPSGGQPSIDLTPRRLPQLEQLETFLQQEVYGHRRLARMDAKARRLVHAVFDAYLAEPRLLPERYVQRIDQQGPHRVICDYLAGMTDRFCLDEYRQRFDPFERI
jgi:dGTPase